MSENTLIPISSRRTKKQPIQQLEQPIQQINEPFPQLSQIKSRRFIIMNNLKFNRFDGSTDINSWLEEFEFNKVICKWTEEELKSIIPASLSGSAKTWFLIKKDNLNTYNKFVEEIRKDFVKLNFRTLKNNVETRRQKNNESFGNYCLDMFKLCKEWRTDIKEIEIVNYIYDGTNSALRSKLASHLEPSFMEFMNKGKILEELLDKELNVIEKPFNNNKNNYQYSYNSSNKNKNHNQHSQQQNFSNYKKNNFQNQSPKNQHFNENRITNNNKSNYNNGRNNNFNNGRNNYVNTRNNNQNRNVRNNSTPRNFKPRFQNKWKPRTNIIEEEEYIRNNEDDYINNEEDETNLLISTDHGILKAEFKLNNLISSVVLDTGSSISLINSDFASKLRVKIDDLSTKITTANNTHLNVFGKSMIQLEIDNKKYQHEFLVSHFKYPVLVGMDFLEKYNFIIDLKNKSMTQRKLTSTLINDTSDVNDLIKKYSNIFNDNPSSPALVEPMKIELTTEKCKSVYYRTSQTEDVVISQEIKKMLNLNIIRKSKSSFSFPVILVKKKDQTFRFCIDFRNLNKITTRDSYPLPRIDEMLNKLGNARYFTKLDCSSGYWQIPLNENDKYKTAFKTKDGLFEFNVLPFGLVNAPSHFQRIMNQLLEPYVNFSSVYLDDVIVYSNTLEEHLIHLDKIFALLKKVNLRLKIKKCEFSTTTIEYLGHKVKQGQISPLTSKVNAIENAKPPSNIKELQQFLGIVNYYRKFIPNFSQKASVLYDLLKKNTEFKFGEKEFYSFNLLKKCLMTEPIFLNIPNFNSTFEL
jgi:predicted aspartyl protease